MGSVKHRLWPVLCVLALSTVVRDAGAQVRRQIQEPDLEASIDSVFGDIIDWISYLPFYNIAGWLGLSTDPTLRREGKGNPIIERISLDSGGIATRAGV